MSHFAAFQLFHYAGIVAIAIAVADALIGLLSEDTVTLVLAPPLFVLRLVNGCHLVWSSGACVVT